jgi:hypothetical protein
MRAVSACVRSETRERKEKKIALMAKIVVLNLGQQQFSLLKLNISEWNRHSLIRHGVQHAPNTNPLASSKLLMSFLIFQISTFLSALESSKLIFNAYWFIHNISTCTI